MGDIIRFGYTLQGRPVERRRLHLDGTHGLIKGKTNSGKSLLLTELITQFIEDYERDGMPCRDAVIVIDGSGDHHCYHRIREAAIRWGRTFRTLALNADQSDHFDPMQVGRYLGNHTLRFASFLCTAFGLVYGQSYGRSFYGRLNEHDFVTNLERLAARRIMNPTTWDFAREMQRMLKENRRSKELSEAVLATNLLRFYPQLMPAADRDRAIDLVQAIDEAHVVYAFLPTLREPQPARVLQSMFSFAVVHAALYRVDEGRPSRVTRLIHDEFSQALNQTLVDGLALGRRGLVHWTGALQDSTQMTTPDADLRSTIKTNTSWKLYFDSPSEDDDNELLHYSKTRITELGGRSTKNYSATYSTRQIEEPVLQINEIRDVSSTKFHAFLIDELGSGHHEPEHIVCKPTGSKADYDRLKNLPLPKKTPAVCAASATVHPAQTQAQANAQAKRRAAIAAVFAAIVAKQNWKSP